MRFLVERGLLSVICAMNGGVSKFASLPEHTVLTTNTALFLRIALTAIHVGSFDKSFAYCIPYGRNYLRVGTDAVRRRYPVPNRSSLEGILRTARSLQQAVLAISRFDNLLCIIACILLR